MSTLVAVVALSAGLTLEEPPRPLVATLGDVVKAVFPDKAYTVEYGAGLEVCPVVYRFERRATPKEELVGLCKVLYLDYTFDDVKRTVTIKRGTRLRGTEKATLVRDSITRLANEVRPLLNAEPARIFEATHALKRQADAESDPENRALLQMRSFYVRGLLSSETSVLIRSLVADPGRTIATFQSRYAVDNHLSLSPDARGIWDAFVAGNGFYATDFKHPEDVESGDWARGVAWTRESRKLTATYRELPPIPLIRHHGTGAQLLVVTPNSSSSPAVVTFNQGLPKKPLPPPSQDIARIPLPKVGPWRGGWYSRNGLSFLAEPLKLNYAAWLSNHVFVWIPKMTLQEMLRQGFYLEEKRTDGWLSFHEPYNPLTLTSPGWGILFQLQPAFEQGDSQRLLPLLEALTPKQIASLEGIGFEGYDLLPESFRSITGGVRLYRAALRLKADPKASGKESIPYDALPRASREDLLAFFRSAFCFDFYPQLLHPANASNLRRTSLAVERVNGEVTSVGIDFPRDWNPIDRSMLISYSTRPQGSADSQSASGSRTLSPPKETISSRFRASGFAEDHGKRFGS